MSSSFFLKWKEAGKEVLLEKTMAQLSGYVSSIKFHNEENGYTVMEIESEDFDMIAVGTMSGVEPGICLELEGELVMHPSYGEQFAFTSYREVPPEDSLQMERYLGSGAIKGVGPALAARIVRRFKDKTFDVIEREPERLSEVKGISEKKAMDISSQLQEKKEQRQAMMFLQKYGIPMNLGVKIYQKYGLDMYKIINENPYQLADEMKGVGFRTADEIAKKVGIHTDSDFRIRSGIIYTLMQASGQGHTFLPVEKLLDAAETILNVDREVIETQIENLAMDRKLRIKVEEDGLKEIYANSFYYMEEHSAQMLHQLNLDYKVDEKQLESYMELIEKEEKITLDEIQKNALRLAAKKGVLILTGGPGTGKTTTINAMLRYFEMDGADIMLAAPTGRAAKRMTEMTGFEAKTIHRLLEVSGESEDMGSFTKDDENPLETDVIIVDEMSMVDITLLYALLKAIAPGTRLILVGDADQLPSVGPGSVLKDMIASGVIPTVKLQHIFRQDESSRIVVNAHKINQGEMVEIDNKNKDFFFIKRYDANLVINVTLQLILEKLPSYVDCDPLEIQVMTPTRKGLLGVDHLNQVLQRFLNPEESGKKERQVGDTILREGDKVMQIKNNYQLGWEVTNKYNVVVEEGLGVFNGDMGRIRRIDEYLEQVEVVFDENKVVRYPFSGLDELELAYAVTVHKSQGSEYPAVIIPLLMGPRPLMNRNLLYTAVTRAKKCVTIVGSEDVFCQMIENATQQRRYSGLEKRLKECEA